MNYITTIYIADEPRGFVLVFNREQISLLQTICDITRDDDGDYPEVDFADDLYHAITNATEKHDA